MKPLLLFSILTILVACATMKPVSKEVSLQESFYTLKDIKSIAEWKYGFDLKELKHCDLYIFDGIPHNENNIDSVLTEHKKEDIGAILVIDTEAQAWFHRNCDLFTIITTKRQTEREKKKLLKEVKQIYNDGVPDIIVKDYVCAECPVLSLNGKIIHNPYDRKELVNRLKKEDIDYIVRIHQKVNYRQFGSNSENGIIEINLKENIQAMQ